MHKGSSHVRKRNWKEASLCRILNISDFYVHENALSAHIVNEWTHMLNCVCKYVQWHNIKAQIHKFSQQMLPFTGEKFSLLFFFSIPFFREFFFASRLECTLRQQLNPFSLQIKIMAFMSSQLCDI